MQVRVIHIHPKSYKACVSTLTIDNTCTVREAAKLASAIVTDSTQFLRNLERAQGDDLITDGDRIDVSHPLLVDPMTARRLRAEQKTAPRPQPRHGSKHQLIKPLEI